MKRMVVALVALVMTVPVLAQGPGGVHGTVLGVDGRPAAGFQVVLVAPDGVAAGSSDTDVEGRYRIEAVRPGEYGLGVVAPDGAAAPVMAAPTRVASGEDVVRDIRLMEAGDLPARIAPARGGLGVWWAGLSRNQKVFTVLGSLVGTALLFGAGSDDQGPTEPPVTPFRID